MSYRADKLMIDARTDTHRHRQTQASTIPEGQYWPRVKTLSELLALYEADALVTGGIQSFVVFL